MVEVDHRGTLEAILATGAEPAEALGLLAAAHGCACALPFLLERLRLAKGGWRGAGKVVPLLIEVALWHPGLAQEGLTAWGRNRTITSSLYLEGCSWVTSLPQGMAVAGDLWLDGSGIRSLPAGLKVAGSLFLRDTPLEGLPECLVVGGDLCLDGARMETLPDDLRVEGGLDLKRSMIQTMPSGLRQVNALWLEKSQIRFLPDGLRVRGCLVLDDCANLEALPKGLWVGQNLHMERTAIVFLPDNLEVNWGLVIENCPAWDGRIPEGARIGELCSDAHPRPNKITLAAWRDLHPEGERPEHPLMAETDGGAR
jgi:hypothetical protein